MLPKHFVLTQRQTIVKF